MPHLVHPLPAACRRPPGSLARLLTGIAAALLAGAALLPSPAVADDLLVRFDGGIGSQPLRSPIPPSTTPAPNVVQGVNPGGIPWVIAELRADVRTDGKIRVNGRGLLLAGGNGVGTNGNQSVRARLFCDGAASDTGLVTLEPNGDFRIDDRLVPTPPSPCNAPVLLIVSGGGNWFAAGIPDR
jgi:hypothetical protein